MVEREEGGGKYFPVLSQLLIKNLPPVVAVGEKVADSGREEWWGEGEGGRGLAPERQEPGDRKERDQKVVAIRRQIEDQCFL